MKNKEPIEERSLIKDYIMLAKFVGYKRESNHSGRWDTGRGFYSTTTLGLQFTESWDKLMTVVEKVKNLQVEVKIGNRWCQVESHKGDYDTSMGAGTSLMAVYISMVLFVEWFNKK